MIELWKDVENFEGLYRVSDTGRVLSLVTNKILSNTIDKSGYLKVTLYKFPTTYCCLLHRLVAQAFIPNPCNLPVVMHKDNNKQNCGVSNLIWGTHKENTQAAMRDGLYGSNSARLVKQFSKQGVYLATYNSAGDASRSIGKPWCSSHISAACRGERITAYGYRWEYADGQQ